MYIYDKIDLEFEIVSVPSIPLIDVNEYDV